MCISTPSFRLRPARPFPFPLSLPHAAVSLPSSTLPYPRSLPLFYVALFYMYSSDAWPCSLVLLFRLSAIHTQGSLASSYGYCLLLPHAHCSRSLESFPTSAHRTTYTLLTYAYHTLARTALLLYLGSCYTDLSSSPVPLPSPPLSLSLSRTRRHICIQVRPPVHSYAHATNWQSIVLEHPSRHTTGPTFEQASHLENRCVCILSYTSSRIAYIPY